MIHKYTLYCVPGELFRSGRHFLVLDEWFTGSGFLILAHGIMSENEYRSFLQKESIPVYQSLSFSWVGLWPAHESRKYADTQFCGYLHRKSKKEWGGKIYVC